MITGNNKTRLEQEIANLIHFIADGRAFFFAITGYSLISEDEFLNHWESKELFVEHSELRQLTLNIQLLYIKLASYYRLLGERQIEKEIRKKRLVFAHELTDVVFNKRVKYNLFLHKVTQNFREIEFIVYEEDPTNDADMLVETLVLKLDDDIKNFLAIWGQSISNSRPALNNSVEGKTIY